MLLAVALAAAQPTALPDDQWYTVTKIETIWTSPFRCNAGNAARLSVTRLAAEPERWRGRCVMVHGWWRHRAFYVTRREASVPAALAAVAPDRHVGIYGHPELLRTAPDHAVRATAIGRVGTCAALVARADTVSGYCHCAHGTYLAIADMDAGR